MSSPSSDSVFYFVNRVIPVPNFLIAESNRKTKIIEFVPYIMDFDIQNSADSCCCVVGCVPAVNSTFVQVYFAS